MSCTAIQNEKLVSNLLNLDVIYRSLKRTSHKLVKFECYIHIINQEGFFFLTNYVYRIWMLLLDPQLRELVLNLCKLCKLNVIYRHSTKRPSQNLYNFNVIFRSLTVRASLKPIISTKRAGQKKLIIWIFLFFFLFLYFFFTNNVYRLLMLYPNPQPRELVLNLCNLNVIHTHSAKRTSHNPV